ncbi:glutamine--fructose-6-phosphate transaminase (isomerizing) [Methanocalculus taiwanensis]|uniref:Glutamine--fructose-6-phosphate aminotransferase [isomerizing] n=1 Tax=Methanocalculus taiwanensis TaxID=106207 RepID=A0ABD4TL55_9EURY|nr:glutamine--fructose-6-phosphate transaminase (isomerizing) [Methanocalculus taiwanensis]MCQ1539171.1 glutamine--fructose-6-phosphate transaminase (isomerizing) [Methanocalculus taiwanensis]
MCGIVGYIGRRQAARIIIDGLKKLEYRGYDSFGLATLNGDISLAKKGGRISDAGSNTAGLSGRIGIGHTRWATHGIPNDQNAHPHLDCTGKIAVVHNGIIENYAELRRDLTARGHTFRSDTDTEVISHLVEEHFQGDLSSAVAEVLPLLEGSYAILVIAEGDDRIIAARKASPLVIGIGDRELFCASDVTPLIDHTRRVIYLDDGDCAVLSCSGCLITTGGEQVSRPVEEVDWDIMDARKGGFAHYMQKEIFEQPQVFYNTVHAVRESPEALAYFVGSRMSLMIVACGSSYHAALLYKYLIESYCDIPVRVEIGSEFKYYAPPLTVPVIGITQSGETADTLAALKMAKAWGCPTIAITNVVGSSVTRIADATIYTRAGPEMSVAATKSFIAQLAAGLQITAFLSDNTALEMELNRVNIMIEDTLTIEVEDAVALCCTAQSIFFIGRGLYYPVALEGALKMKEISYIHAEGYAAGELKHGPFALLSPDTPVIALAMPGKTYPVMISNIKEIKARGAPVIGIGIAGDSELPEIVDLFIPLPPCNEVAGIAMASVMLQRLAYYVADGLGCDIDKPRNLAKSVTVE